MGTNKRIQINTKHNNMNNSQNHHAQRKKPGTKTYILYDSIRERGRRMDCRRTLRNA